MMLHMPYRPWGELTWALQLTEEKRWHYIGCLSTEERSVEPLVELHEKNLLATHHLIRVLDTAPEDVDKEKVEIKKRIDRFQSRGMDAGSLSLPLDIRVNLESCPAVFDFGDKSALCLDISCLPKRFFFPILKAAYQSSKVKDLLVLYAKPARYPERSISSNPNAWGTIDQFSCIDDALEKEAEKHLIINTGFVVGGLVDYIKEPREELDLDILVPFPAEPWQSVRRSWKSAHDIEKELGGVNSDRRPNYHRVPALDASTAFDRLLSLTNFGKQPSALAPLGPKPTSLAMCLLASQTDRHPVYYAQPKTYAINYSEGYEKTYAYWIKHNGEDLYSL